MEVKMDIETRNTPFICPVCGESLFKNAKSIACENGHSFDMARSGYVNLLMSSQKAKQHGDDKEMIRARTEFLNRGFYNPLSEKVCEVLGKCCTKTSRIVDAGCGECKYTSDIYDSIGCETVGIDISKQALSAAHRRARPLWLAVASASDMPIADASADAVVNIFAPFFAGEFSRILKDGGVAVRVYPLARHLWELKALVYEKPYENPESDMNEQGFEVIDKHEVKFNMELKSPEDVRSLFAMTPYYYRTGNDDKTKLDTASPLICSAEFGICVYRKL